ncbi:hypothetical protein D9613_002388 [Agrocybe pediades]|uniref:Heme peroxidase n=1 Tax=Agrocybe pediades TaxID=84607 RepID=A0A8H4VX33_9AGAR|nr:hypothetical protein D9613_002388 [Agrocybe pediades]
MAGINVVQALSLGADAVKLSARDPPTAPTGYYDWEVSSDPESKRKGRSIISNVVSAQKEFIDKGGLPPVDANLIKALADGALHAGAIDDRQGLFGKAFGILARLDPSLPVAKTLNDKVIETLYDTNPHPIASLVGDDYQFRKADGSNNNVEMPDIGKAGMPYARSVQGKSGLPRSSLPDPGLVFDSLLKRDGAQEHGGGMSSLIFAYAAIVTHSLFRTNPNKDKVHLNMTSSYLDLSPLYGENQEKQDKVRDKEGGRGRGLLYPDVFSEERLRFLVPATSALLVLFNRNHNYIAEKILKINERKRWTDPPPTEPAARARQDEEIFQTAKLINCGHFMSSILGDYVAGFLGSSEGLNWNMNPFDIINNKDTKVDRGRGNHVSVEFSVLYRWHATTAEADVPWVNDQISQLFKGKPFDQLSMSDLPAVLGAFQAVDPDPRKRTFDGLQRGKDGKFSDDDLARILQRATTNPASAFRGRGTPPALRLVEIMGMEQARAWGLCTMNEFRKYLGLKQFTSFEEWNPDKKIANAARQLYGHIDNMELYPGLQAESTMPVETGSQFACGYTITRAVLGDAISLIRGDRFYTSDFTPANLTTWGYYDCQRDMNNGGMGGEIPKLLMRHLPRHYPWNSVYSLYPFFTPAHMKKSLTKQGIQDKYTFDLPIPQPVPKILNTLTGIRNVFNDSTKFNVIYEKFGYGSILMFDDIGQHDKDRQMIMHAIFPDKASVTEWANYFAKMVSNKIKESSFSYDGVPGKYVDIVKGVLYPAVAHVSAERITGIPLKTKENPNGIYTELEMFDMLAVLFTNTFLVFDKSEVRFAMHEASIQAGTAIATIAAKKLIETAPQLAVGDLIGDQIAAIKGLASGISSFLHPNAPPKYADSLFGRLGATGRPVDELIGNLMGIAVGASVNHGHATVNVVDFYLDPERQAEKDEIIKLVKKGDAKSDALLLGYVNEAMRLRPQFDGLWRLSTVDAVIDQGPNKKPLEIKKGDLLRASFRNAHLDRTDFPNPTKVNPERTALPFPHINGTGFHTCPGVEYAQKAIVEALKVIFSLKNIRRAPGDAGTLKRFEEIVHETPLDNFIQRNGTVSPWPSSMFLVYDP